MRDVSDDAALVISAVVEAEQKGEIVVTPDGKLNPDNMGDVTLDERVAHSMVEKAIEEGDAGKFDKEDA